MRAASHGVVGTAPGRVERIRRLLEARPGLALPIHGRDDHRTRLSRSSSRASRSRAGASPDSPTCRCAARRFAVARDRGPGLVISVLPGGDHTVHTTLHLRVLRPARRASRRQPPDRRRADRRVRRAAELRRDRGQRRRHAGRPDAIASLARTLPKGEFANSPDPRAPASSLFLGDVFATPASLPIHNVFSIGDGILLIGVLVLVHVACGSRLVPRRFTSPTPPPPDVPGGALRCAGAHVLRRPRAVVPRARASPTWRCRCWPTTASAAPWAVAAVLLPDLLPAIVLGPLLGALVDRIGWRTCAAIADALRCLAFLLVMSANTLPTMIAGALLCGLGTALFTPAALAGLPRLMDRDDARAAAMSLFGALDDIRLDRRPGARAVALAAIAPATLMDINAATFAVSAGPDRHARDRRRRRAVCDIAARHAPAGARARSRPARRSARCSRPPPASSCASASPTSARSCSRARSCTSAARASPRWSPPAASAPCSARLRPLHHSGGLGLASGLHDRHGRDGRRALRVRRAALLLARDAGTRARRLRQRPGPRPRPGCCSPTARRNPSTAASSRCRRRASRSLSRCRSSGPERSSPPPACKRHSSSRASASRWSWPRLFRACARPGRHPRRVLPRPSGTR